MIGHKYWYDRKKIFYLEYLPDRNTGQNKMEICYWHAYFEADLQTFTNLVYVQIPFS